MKFGQSINRSPLIAVFGIAAGVVLAACASSTVSKVSSQRVSPNGLTPGSIVIAKRLPDVTELQNIPLYGFLPFQPLTKSISSSGEELPSVAPTWVEVDVSNQTLSVKRGVESVLELAWRGEQHLQTAQSTQKTSVLTVAEDPTWLATDTYFTDRGLSIPPEGDASRFLKGALGNMAIFLENGSVIHSGPQFEHLLKTPSQPTGFQMEEKDIRAISALLEPGSKVVIR